MKAEVSMSQVYYNHSILNFFFRTQSENTFNELFEKVTESKEEVFEAIENYSDDLDEVEEMFYNDSIDEIISTLSLSPIEEEDEN